jgi:hypothetical protein
MGYMIAAIVVVLLVPGVARPVVGGEGEARRSI